MPFKKDLFKKGEDDFCMLESFRTAETNVAFVGFKREHSILSL